MTFYGGKGIRVCPEWESFETFFADMGPRPEGMSLERKDGSKNYCKDNCKWATRKEQMRNTTKNAWVQWQGRTITVAELAEETGTPYEPLRHRIRDLKWSIERAIQAVKIKNQ